MTEPSRSALGDLLRANEDALLASWIERQKQASRLVYDRAEESGSREFLRLFRDAVDRAGTGIEDTSGESWLGVREWLSSFSGERAQRGYSPTETATFIFSLKYVLFNALRERLSQDQSARLVEAITAVTLSLDSLGLYTLEWYQKGREKVISRQQQEMLELSTPVVELADGVLALPLIGTLDSSRTQVVMESLLERIVETSAEIAIIDITGVPTVDTLVAQHLLKTVAAARLMGADCMISGIRPQIAQTIVHLGVELGSVTTKATLADAFTLALQRTGRTITRAADAPGR
jgi:rsbT co-antagonist protein RsbR